MIPNECIHFNREVNSGKNYNAQIDLIPLLGNKDADLNKMLAANLKVREDDILSLTFRFIIAIGEVLLAQIRNILWHHKLITLKVRTSHLKDF